MCGDCVCGYGVSARTVWRSCASCNWSTSMHSNHTGITLILAKLHVGLRWLSHFTVVYMCIALYCEYLKVTIICRCIFSVILVFHEY